MSYPACCRFKDAKSQFIFGDLVLRDALPAANAEDSRIAVDLDATDLAYEMRRY